MGAAWLFWWLSGQWVPPVIVPNELGSVSLFDSGVGGLGITDALVGHAALSEVPLYSMAATDALVGGAALSDSGVGALVITDRSS